MSIYDDVKKAITEFLVPEMKAEIATVRGEIGTLRETVNQNEKRAQERHDTMMRDFGWRFDALKSELQLSRRIETLEREREERKAESH